MHDRSELHESLCEILGSRNVYFQAPSSILMRYPAIRYRLSNIVNSHANNSVYSHSNRYEITVIDEDPDSTIPGRVNELPTARFIRSFVADNLNHWIIEIFY